jgi:hypothetical protein
MHSLYRIHNHTITLPACLARVAVAFAPARSSHCAWNRRTSNCKIRCSSALAPPGENPILFFFLRLEKGLTPISIRILTNFTWCLACGVKVFRHAPENRLQRNGGPWWQGAHPIAKPAPAVANYSTQLHLSHLQFVASWKPIMHLRQVGMV